ENLQMIGDGVPRGCRLVGLNAGRGQERGVPREPQRAFLFAIGCTQMRDHERRARLEPAADLRGDATSLGGIDEVQRQQAGGAVEGGFRSIVDVALMKTRTRREQSEGLPRKPQHGRGWIHAIEAPALMRLRKSLQLEAAAGS